MVDQYRSYVESKVRLCETVLAQAPHHPEWGWDVQTYRNWKRKLARWQAKLAE